MHCKHGRHIYCTVLYTVTHIHTVNNLLCSKLYLFQGLVQCLQIGQQLSFACSEGGDLWLQIPHLPGVLGLDLGRGFRADLVMSQGYMRKTPECLNTHEQYMYIVVQEHMCMCEGLQYSRALTYCTCTCIQVSVLRRTCTTCACMKMYVLCTCTCKGTYILHMYMQRYLHTAHVHVKVPTYCTCTCKGTYILHMYM